MGADPPIDPAFLARPFTGRETVALGGEEVYELTYAGGALS
jgi:hypothetical protein